MKEIKSTSVLVFSVNSICQVAISEYLDIVSVSEIGKLYQENGIILDNYCSDRTHAVRRNLFSSGVIWLYQMRMMLILQTTY
jgi:hypothetical protein